MNPAVRADDFRLDTGNGQIFARRWRPAVPVGDAPIVLLHDSLGCVALWRDFPERLARATSRTVIAYDRLGFGESDAHPGRLEGNFIRDEAHASFAALRQAMGIGRFIAFDRSGGQHIYGRAVR